MKKRILILTMALSLIAGLASVSRAQVSDSKSFVVSASVLKATGITIAASKVIAATNQWSSVVGNAMSFDPMEISDDGVWLPKHFFAVDVGATGGAGSPSVTMTYTEGVNPNTPGKGLGWKSTATFVRVEGPDGDQTEVPLTAFGPKKLLKDLAGLVIPEAQIIGGFLRVYLGIVSGDPAANDPVGAEPFTNADAAGKYEGTLVISATVI